ncbi:hypothetical protein BC628DRAFT_1367817 [Trametes gibbosa]|nr:hypothetical protein BC628DRAFT_1367817 [Trametes gibbosa]
MGYSKAILDLHIRSMSLLSPQLHEEYSSPSQPGEIGLLVDSSKHTYFTSAQDPTSFALFTETVEPASSVEAGDDHFYCDGASTTSIPPPDGGVLGLFIEGEVSFYNTSEERGMENVTTDWRTALCTEGLVVDTLNSAFDTADSTTETIPPAPAPRKIDLFPDELPPSCPVRRAPSKPVPWNILLWEGCISDNAVSEIMADVDEEINSWSSMISDFTLPEDFVNDIGIHSCVPTAYARRAERHNRRSQERERRGCFYKAPRLTTALFL